MLRSGKYLIPATLFTGMTVAAVAFSQPPNERGPGDKGEKRDKGDKKGFPPFKAKGPFDRKGGPPRGELWPIRHDEAVVAWAKTLIENINHPHDTVRESARVGLIAIGLPALPLLRPIIEGDDDAKAVAARKVAEHIEALHRFADRPAFGRRGFRPPMPGGQHRNDGDRDDKDGRRGGPPMPDRRNDDGAGGRDGRRGGPPFAPPPRGRGERSDGPDARPLPVERVLARLDLDDKQKGEVAEIVQAHHKRMRETFEKVREGTLERENVGKAMLENHETLLKNLRGVLGEEKFARIHEWIPFPGARGGPPARPDADGPSRERSKDTTPKRD